MIERHYIICKTCSEPHTLRIGVGHNKLQEHTFHCTNCSEAIKVVLEVDFENIQTELKFIENCERGNEEGRIVNLHPDFAIDQSKLHADYTFPSMDYMSMNSQNWEVDGGMPSIRQQNEIKRSLFLIEEWEAVKRAWSLMLNEKYDLAIEITNSDSVKFGYDDNLESVNDWIFRFSYRILNPTKLPLFNKAAAFIKENVIEKYPEELKRFKKFYDEKLYQVHFERYFESYSEFFLNYSEYSQLIIYIKRNSKLPRNYHVSSNGFKNTKMFFGNAYEALTSNLLFLACYNNIANGRPFDKFNSMDLKKYMTINKANRANPFKDAQPLYRFADCLDSSLRNASHHGAVSFNKKKKEIIYRSGGTGSEKTITYTDYLMKCNNLLFSLAALMMLEFLLHNANF